MRTTQRSVPRLRRAPLRPGLLLRRRPRLGWLVTGLVALGAAIAVGSIVASAEQARAAWGASRTVLVATHDLRPGTPLDEGDVTLTRRPVAGLAEGALGALPEDAVVRHAVFAGEELLAGHLAPAGQIGLAARLDGRTRAVAIPVEPGLVPPLEPGQRVDVVVVLPDEAFDGEPAFVVAPRAEVLDVSQQAVTVAVSADDAPRIVAALTTGVVTVTLTGT